MPAFNRRRRDESRNWKDYRGHRPWHRLGDRANYQKEVEWRYLWYWVLLVTQKGKCSAWQGTFLFSWWAMGSNHNGNTFFFRGKIASNFPE
jgi:hypothetical protein